MGARGEIGHGQKVVGAMPLSRPTDILLCHFWNSKMSQYRMKEEKKGKEEEEKSRPMVIFKVGDYDLQNASKLHFHWTF